MNLQDAFELNTTTKELKLKAPYAEVHIPQDFIEHGIATIIGQEIELFGLFDILVWETEDKEASKPTKIAFSFPSMIRTVPSRIDHKKVGDEGEYIFEYSPEDLFIKTTRVAKVADISRAFVDILFKGYIPDSISYDELPRFWAKCNQLNGVNMRVMNVVIEVIIAAFARDPNQMEIPFRIGFGDKRKKYTPYSRKLVRVMDLPRLTSTFASLSSADPKQGITTSIVGKRTGRSESPTPVEDAIL